jgi:hypothetical protein
MVRDSLSRLNRSYIDMGVRQRGAASAQGRADALAAVLEVSKSHELDCNIR